MREAIAVPGAPSIFPVVNKPLPPLGGSAIERMARWDRSVLSQMAMHDLLQCVRFKHLPNEECALELVGYTAGTVFEKRNGIVLKRPSQTKFLSELQYVIDLAELREDRGAEILTQIGGLLPYLGLTVPLTAERTPATLHLLELAAGFATQMYLRFKHEFGCWRPAEYSPQVQPIVPTPGHAAYPMGHATEVFMIAYILRQLMEPYDKVAAQSAAQQLNALAFRVSMNRIVAGVHFPIDLTAGLALGAWLGRVFLCIAGMNGEWKELPTTFDPDKVGGLTDVESSLANWFTPAKDAKTSLTFSDSSGALNLIAVSALEEWSWLSPVKKKIPPSKSPLGSRP